MNSINPFNEAATQTAKVCKGHTLCEAMSKISYIRETCLSIISDTIILLNYSSNIAFVYSFYDI